MGVSIIERAFQLAPECKKIDELRTKLVREGYEDVDDHLASRSFRQALHKLFKPRIMCNRYRVSAKQIEVAQRYGVDVSTLFPEPERLPPPELFPKRDGWVVRTDGGKRKLDVMRWGVPLNGKPITNVRNLASPFWRSMLKDPARRCLVPVTSFCEWSGEKGSKQEHWFTLPSQPIFTVAGIWRPTTEGNAYAFLTCEPNPLVAPIHEKAMPVIVHEEDYDRWLDGEVEDACSLAQPFPSQLMAVDHPEE